MCQLHSLFHTELLMEPISVMMHFPDSAQYGVEVNIIKRGLQIGGIPGNVFHHFCMITVFSPHPGDVINLGDRLLTVLHMPGHSRGSICLHDRDNKLLFSGDVVYDGAMIDWLPYSQVSDYVSSCERLVGLVDSEQVDQVLPGHYNAFGAKRLHRLASTYVSRAGTCSAKFSTLAWRTMAGLALRASNPRSAC
uniref:Metallo-beta-lactamase domain containing 2 n=1 Tax=Nothobranchius furzeri TaxID=105023 RepID=A0A1A7ZFI1_NOTFU